MDKDALQPANPLIQVSYDNHPFLEEELAFKVFNSRLSLSFQEVGRESLGILPPDHFIRGSFSFIDHSFSDNVLRDSLNCTTLEFDNFGRESIEGRESLGILQINKQDLRFGDENACIPEVLPPIDENSIEIDGYSLNTGFLFSKSRQLSARESQSLSFVSFHSNSLDGPSKIYRLSRSDSPKNTNMALSLLNNARLLNTECDENRQRFHSVPDCLDHMYLKPPKILLSFQGEILDQDNEVNFHDSVFIEGSHIANKIADGSILNKSFDGTDVLDSTPQPIWPNEFDKSTEAEIPAVEQKNVFKEIDKMIPANTNVVLDLPLSKKHNSSETIKTPSPNSIGNSHVSSKSDNKLQDPRLILQNLSEILNNTKRSDSQRSEGQNLISSLADILCDKNSNSSKQNVALDDSGRSSIAEQSDSPEKIIHQCYEVLDLSKKCVDDPKISSSPNEVLDLSLKNRINQVDVNDRLSQSFDSKNVVLHTDQKKRTPSLTGLDCLTSKKIVNNPSMKNNEVMLPNFKTKLRSAPGTANKKGPLKATIPVKEMKSNLGTHTTPEKTEKKQSSIQTRTSTPIRDSGIKPMAASTPINLKEPDSSPKVKQRLQSTPKSSSQANIPRGLSNSAKCSSATEIPKIRKLSAISSLVPRKRSSSANTMKINSDSNGAPSTPTASRQQTVQSPSLLPKMESRPYRRNSVSEDSRVPGSVRNALRPATFSRRNSIEKESGLLDVRDKVKEVSKSRSNAAANKNILSEKNNNIGLNVKMDLLKPVNQILNKKKTGKENSCI